VVLSTRISILAEGIFRSNNNKKKKNLKKWIIFMIVERIELSPGWPSWLACLPACMMPSCIGGGRSLQRFSSPKPRRSGSCQARSGAQHLGRLYSDTVVEPRNREESDSLRTARYWSSNSMHLLMKEALEVEQVCNLNSTSSMNAIRLLALTPNLWFFCLLAKSTSKHVHCVAQCVYLCTHSLTL